MSAFVERKQLEMALGPGIVCQQLHNQTAVPRRHLLQKQAVHVTNASVTVVRLARRGSPERTPSLGGCSSEMLLQSPRGTKSAPAAFDGSFRKTDQTNFPVK